MENLPLPGFFPIFNGKFRILKWRYCTSYKAIFCGDIPLHRPYIGLIYGRYIQFRFLKWPLRYVFHSCLVMCPPSPPGRRWPLRAVPCAIPALSPISQPNLMLGETSGGSPPFSKIPYIKSVVENDGEKRLGKRLFFSCFFLVLA